MKRTVVVVLAIAACGDPEPTSQLPTGELIGRVEIAPDIPTAGCLVLIEGSPLGGPCDGAGAFDIPGVVPGRWDLRIVADAATALPSRRVAAAANPGFVTDLGAIRIAEPGAIGGHVLGATDGIVVVPAFGLVSAPNDNGGYVIQGVPPGIHEVAFVSDAGTVARGGISVSPGKTTIKVDLDAATALGGATTIDGRALRANAGNAGHRGLTVELIDARTGAIVTTAETAADGTFALATSPGIFAVRARDGDSPITAVIPSVVPLGQLPLHLPSPLVIFPLGDLDHDGFDDDADPDIDNDGVPNDADAFPYDPAESMDADGDGLGDRADLATHGAALDTQTATPDSDGDGLLDFEDACPAIADPAQLDADGDGVGNACDNCPLVANADQADAVGNGVGNACRACNGNEACPLGQTCQQGACVECSSSAQCNGEVCVAGGCVPCSAAQACDVGLCNVPLGVCQECLVDLDCGAGEGCVAGRCFAQCDSDPDCGPAAFCVGHVCAACRSNADCPSTQYCDGGLCQPQCSVDANCTGGRICDLDTRTCELPCGSGCPTGQTCVQPANICEASCDLSFPCPGGQVCTAGVCGPACTIDTQCGALEVCQLGECVPSGACVLDTDCPAAEMCGAFGACIARPTAFDPGAGAFTCNTACECKLGEICAAGHCVADPVPTRFVAPGAAGNGLSISSPAGSLQTALANLPANATVAILATPTLSVTGVPTAVTAANVTIQGGYTACNASRWVRDPGASSRVAATDNDLLVLGGNFAAPTPGLVVRNLRLVPASNRTGVVASFTPGLVIEDVVLEPSAGSPTGIEVRASTGVVLQRIAVASFTNGSSLEGITFETSAGTIRDLALGLATNATTVTGLHVVAASGPVTIERVTSELWSFFNRSQPIHVEATTSPVTIRDSHFKPVTAVGGGAYANIFVEDSTAVAIADCSSDGAGFIDPAASPFFSQQNAVRFDNSAGTVERYAVELPLIKSQQFTSPFFVLGPRGDVRLTDLTVTGRGGPTTRMIDLEAVTDSTVVVEGGSFSSIQTGTIRAVGVFADDARFVVTDASFTLPGNAVEVYGFEATSGSTGRIERSRFRPGGEPTVTSRSAGGRVTGGSTVELYGNWLVGGGPATSESVGLWLDGDFTVRAIGNTLEGGGTPGQPGASIGVLCEPGAGQGAATLTSNIVDGGLAANHFMVQSPSPANACATPSAWDHAYFAFRAGGARSASALEIADDIAAGSATCQLRDAQTCFATADPITGFLLAPTATCIDAGVAGTRLDGSPITLDLLGNPRVSGGAADIGAHER